MNWSEFTAELERIQRQFRIKSTKGIADLDAHHKQLSQSAAEIFAAMRDEAQIDVDHGNGAGDLVRRQVRTIREYLSSLDRIADALTSVEGDRQDAYDNTPTRDWYSRGARNMSDRKFNPNHDPDNGRFTSGDGSSGGVAGLREVDDHPRYAAFNTYGRLNVGNIRDFERDYGVDLETVSKPELEAALAQMVRDGGGDGDHEFAEDLARAHGLQKSAPPGAHKAYS